MLIIDKNLIYSCCFTAKPQNGYRIIWELTSKCNYNCRFCYLSSNYQDLNTDKVIDVLNIMIRSQIEIDEILLAGKEVFIRKDLEEIIKQILNNDIKISISTNGSSFKNLKKILRYNTNIRSVNLSIYSSNPKINDKLFRNSNGSSLIKIERTVNYLKNADVGIKVNIPLHKENFNELPSTIEYIAGLGVKKISLMPILPIGHAKNMNYNFQNILDLSRTSFFFKLQDLSRSLNLKIIPLRIRLLNSQKWLDKCYAGLKFIAILPNGIIAPCNLIPTSKSKIYNGIFYKNNLRNYLEQIKIYYHNENLKIKNLLNKSSSSRIECGGGCRAIITTERENNFLNKPFEKFYERIDEVEQN